MRTHLGRAALVALLCLPLVPAFAAASKTDCRKSAIDALRTSAPDGFAIYQRMPDKGVFTRWIDCDDLQLALATAVHESVHAITADTDAFPLDGGGDIPRPHEVSRFFPPAQIAGLFKSSDLKATYLRPGQSSSSQDFLYLLDELNAYTHDLDAAIALERLHPADAQVDHRDGLAALMAFVALYAQTAQESQPATWSGLTSPPVAKTVAALWDRAETVMAASCPIANFGTEDQTFIRQACGRRAQASIEVLIGRAPVCPVACLAPRPSADLAGDDAGAMPSVGRVARAAVDRPFWSRAVTRRAAPQAPLEIGPVETR